MEHFSAFVGYFLIIWEFSTYFGGTHLAQRSNLMVFFGFWVSHFYLGHYLILKDDLFYTD